MKKTLFGLIFVFVFSAFVTAQNQAEEYNKVEVFTGYSNASHVAGDDSIEPLENGFDVSAVYNIRRYVGIKADFTGTYRNFDGVFYSTVAPVITLGSYRAAHSIYNATVGVQFKDNRRESRFKPFGHILVGYAKHRDKIKTACPAGAECPPFNADFQGVSTVFGGGLDIKINRRIDIRAAQFDLNPIFYKYEQRTALWFDTRFSTGIVVKF